MAQGKLFLIPAPLGDAEPGATLPQSVLDTACGLRCFVVEELRTARRFLSRYGLRGHIDELDFHILNEHTTPAEVEALLPLFDGQDVGLMSEAGLPAVADPGAALVALCHRHGIEVVPLVGPSSLMLALMGSGLNGQSFAFCGYLPAKTDERRQAIIAVEKRSRQLHQTQIFIETPYRSDALLGDLIATCNPSTRLAVAANATMPDALYRMKTVARWREEAPLTIGKRPCVFLILA
jgi:16S rRNA (cytidine1402-2'-O)-methyltransferase